MKPSTADAYRLFHEGVLALADVERAGMRVDVEYLERAIEEVTEQIDEANAEMQRSGEWKEWRRRFGSNAKLGSRMQLAKVLFGEKGKDGEEDYEGLGYEAKGRTQLGKRAKADEEALSQVDIPFVKTWLRTEKLKKLRSTNLNGVLREVVDGRIHPLFNLNLVRTFRGSADSPNVQQLPVRDAESGELIRRCFIPEDDHVLIEIDYGALEWRIAACFWRDKAMIADASDPLLDVHRDMAAACYKLPPSEVPKPVRSLAKAHFVFATLYGSYYVNTCRNLWNVIGTNDLQTADSVSLYDHLLQHGITDLGRCSPREGARKGTFEYHIAQVEKRFNRRLPEWSERKEQWQARYKKRGYFKTMTGFTCSGVYSRNDLYNYPIQGPAFHCLLWSLIQLVKRLRKQRMRSRVISQIHDSIIASVHRDEVEDYVAMATQIMTRDVREHWPWIVTPLEVEVEIAERNWFEKKEYAL